MPSPDREALVVSALTKRFPGTTALNDVTLSVHAGEIRALLGENGSGKSTLIKILSGYHQPDTGQVAISGQPLTLHKPKSSYELGARFVHQDLGLVETESTLDNLCFTAGYTTGAGTIKRAANRSAAERAMARVGLTSLDLDEPVGSLSPAERTGVAIARALLSKNGAEIHLLVLDEPTATLADFEVTNLLRIVRTVADSGIAVLYVTHHLNEVFAIADSATVLRDGRHVFTGEVAGLSRAALIKLLVGDELEETKRLRERKTTVYDPAVPPVLQVEELEAAFFRRVSCELRPGEIVGVAGLTGSGREQLCAAIFGATNVTSGSVSISGKQIESNTPRAAIDAGAVYLPPDRKRFGAVLDISARENVSLAGLAPYWSRGRLDTRKEKSDCARWFDNLNVRPRNAAERLFHTFSGGNQQKILFAKWLRLQPKILLLDEPTQGVDIASKAELHRHLIRVVEGGSCAVVASSDLDELVALCDRVLVLRGGLVVNTLFGDQLTVSEISHSCLQTEEGAPTP